MGSKINRVFLIVADSFGCGCLPDSEMYGDLGSNTLRSVCRSDKSFFNEFSQLGLFNIDGNQEFFPPAETPKAAYGKMAEKSAGKDTVSGHWEIAGLISESPFPLYPDGFPDEIIDAFRKATGCDILCNKPYSGTDVIYDYGREHVETGKPPFARTLIVYTSGDSVFQIAAHENVVPIEKLYEYCEIARGILCGENAVGRVIARPFIGDFPNYTRTSNRKDYCLTPHGDTLLDVLYRDNFDIIGIGKIHDIFAGRSLTESYHTDNNDDGINRIVEMIKRDFHGLCFANLVDFDSMYGHRRNADGYAIAIAELDRRLTEMLSLLKKDDVLIITADHGCDPLFKGTDHTREYVPVLIYGDTISPVEIATRSTFADLGKTVADMLTEKTDNDLSGISFLTSILR